MPGGFREARRGSLQGPIFFLDTPLLFLCLFQASRSCTGVGTVGGPVAQGRQVAGGQPGGYRKYLQADGQSFRIDRRKVKEEGRFDGKWVLRTNGWDAPTADVTL